MHLVFFSREAANFIALRNYLFFELHFLPPVVKVTTSLDITTICLGYFLQRKGQQACSEHFQMAF